MNLCAFPRGVVFLLGYCLAREDFPEVFTLSSLPYWPPVSGSESLCGDSATTSVFKVLPLSSRFTLQYLLCDNGLGYLCRSQGTERDVKHCQQRALEGHLKRGNALPGSSPIEVSFLLLLLQVCRATVCGHIQWASALGVCPG